VGGFLLQRNALHSFAPWAQLRQPERQELRPWESKRRKLAMNCASGTNPLCPWNYPAVGLGFSGRLSSQGKTTTRPPPPVSAGKFALNAQNCVNLPLLKSVHCSQVTGKHTWQLQSCASPCAWAAMVSCNPMHCAIV
jgi:hypothetical protein